MAIGLSFPHVDQEYFNPKVCVIVLAELPAGEIFLNRYLKNCKLQHLIALSSIKPAPFFGSAFGQNHLYYQV